MHWKTLTAFLLLFSMWGWLGLPPFWSPAEMAEHYVMVPEGEHCDEVCPHPTSLIDAPSLVRMADGIAADQVLLRAIIARLFPLQVIRAHPPPLYVSTSHSLRAPPPLILA